MALRRSAVRIRYAPFASDMNRSRVQKRAVLPSEVGRLYGRNTFASLGLTFTLFGPGQWSRLVPVRGPQPLPLKPMATLFLEKGRSTLSAKIRVWNAESSSWGWRKIRTGVADRAAALEIAESYEHASDAGKEGVMTREKAERLLASILRTAGVKWASQMPTLQAVGDELFKGRHENIGESTRRKYAAHWKRFGEWSGNKIAWPVDQWEGEVAILREYYEHLREEFSDTTANNHFTTLSMVFLRARAAGSIRGNPVELVERVANDNVEKQVLTRDETARILRAMHRSEHGAVRDSWLCLTALGWNMGHRLQDILSLTGENVVNDEGIWCIRFRPQKTKKKKEARIVLLPIPTYLAKMLKRIKHFRALHHADNRTGLVSDDFVDHMMAAGVDPMAVEKRKRTIHLKSFSSFRHGMTTRLLSAGVSGELARLVTDHESPKTQKPYVHAEVVALKAALKMVKRK
jgi:integrase